MRSELAEECHHTILAYTELLDWERLERAREMDGRYHLAKLICWATWDGQKLHDEHAEWRNSLLTPAVTTPDLWAAAKALHEKARAKGWVSPPPEAQH